MYDVSLLYLFISLLRIRCDIFFEAAYHRLEDAERAVADLNGLASCTATGLLAQELTTGRC